MSYGYDEPPYVGKLEAFEILVEKQYDTFIAKQHTLLIHHELLLGELTRATQPQNALSHYEKKRAVLQIQYEQALLNIDGEEAREELRLYCQGRKKFIDVLDSIWPTTQQTLKPR